MAMNLVEILFMLGNLRCIMPLVSCIVEVVRYLLRAGADPNWTKGNISTPLKEARQYALSHSR